MVNELSKYIFLSVFLFLSLADGATFYQTHKTDDLVHYSKSKYWQYLIHWQDKARIEQDKNTDFAYAELIRTIDIFLHPEEFLKLNRGHPNCIFPARLNLLRKDLDLQVDDVDCPAFNQWRLYHSFDKVAVIYASQFISNPASAMGHVFIKLINTANVDYLNTSIGFVANVTDRSNPFKYIYNGLFGKYQGLFDEGYYFKKVDEYNNIEARDIWEYTLNLTDEEKELFINYIWELKKNTVISYYFFDQNCASVVLFLIEGLRFNNTEDNLRKFYISPPDVLKRLNFKGFIETEFYRPSIRSQMLHKYQRLNSSEKYASLKTIYLGMDLDSDNHYVYGTVLDYFALKRFQKKTSFTLNQQQLEEKSLIVRARMGQVENSPISTPESPLKSHGLIRSKYGLINRSLEKSHWIFELQLIGHDPMDNDAGFLENSSLDLLSTQFSYLPDSHLIELSRLKIIELSNKPDFTLLEPQYAWQLSIEYQKRLELSEQNREGLLLAPAFGLNISVFKSLDFYGLIKANQQFSFKSIDPTWLGSEFGFIISSSSLIKIHAQDISLHKVYRYSDQSHIQALNIQFNNMGNRFHFGLGFSKLNFQAIDIKYSSLESHMMITQEF